MSSSRVTSVSKSRIAAPAANVSGLDVTSTVVSIRSAAM
jgi:hypothetical protein